jgi:hypothetical protein
MAESIINKRKDLSDEVFEVMDDLEISIDKKETGRILKDTPSSSEILTMLKDKGLYDAKFHASFVVPYEDIKATEQAIRDGNDVEKHKEYLKEDVQDLVESIESHPGIKEEIKEPENIIRFPKKEDPLFENEAVKDIAQKMDMSMDEVVKIVNDFKKNNPRKKINIDTVYKEIARVKGEESQKIQSEVDAAKKKITEPEDSPEIKESKISEKDISSRHPVFEMAKPKQKSKILEMANNQNAKVYDMVYVPGTTKLQVSLYNDSGIKTYHVGSTGSVKDITPPRRVKKSRIVIRGLSGKK